MEKITGLQVKDAQGVPRGIAWYVDDDRLRHVITKGDRVTHNIGISRSKFEQIFMDVLDVQKHLENSGSGSENPVVSRAKEFNLQTRVDLVNSVMDSFSEEEAEIVAKKKALNVEDMAFRSMYSDMNGRFEKTYSHVLQMIYDCFGEDWFTPGEFREEYESRFDKGNYTMALKRLTERNRVYREPADEHDIDDNMANYVYRLSDGALKDYYKYDGFVSDKNPRYQRKKHKVKA